MGMFSNFSPLFDSSKSALMVKSWCSDCIYVLVFFHGLRASIPSVLHLYGQASDRPSPFEKKEKAAPELALSFQFQSRHHPQCSIFGTCCFLKYGCGWHKSFVALSTNQSSLIKKLQSIYLLEWEFTLDFTFTFYLASIKKYPLE